MVVAENYVYDGDQRVAVRNATGAIQYEYFDGSSLDQVFADQTMLIRVLWALEDRTGAARDVISTAGVVLDHRKIDSFRRSPARRPHIRCGGNSPVVVSQPLWRRPSVINSRAS